MQVLNRTNTNIVIYCVLRNTGTLSKQDIIVHSTMQNGQETDISNSMKAIPDPGINKTIERRKTDMVIVYINCKLFPFVSWIISGLKLYETRNKNTLKSIIGKQVYIAKTGKGKTIVKCTAVIDSVLRIRTCTEYNKYRNSTCIKKGSCFDWNSETKQKYLYKLTNVKPCQEFTPVPEKLEKHGRSWAVYNP